ncbi:uncharacterized protein LOC118755787, partial [Rhagoletis pomonella]|uniref:uncharacterized protein LOC118755787 n=1 Tax=Rhagoletis pomonella TaxID=28610 RepID=UPI001786C506
KRFRIGLYLCFAFLAIAQLLPAEETNASPEYLPPVDDNSTPLAEDGYRYKAVKRLKYRHRRDVASDEYLSPVAVGPPGEYLPPEDVTLVADDGYRYKTVRRLKFQARHRRDVSELNSFPSAENLPTIDVEFAPEFKNILGDNGCLYRTVRRLKFRRHRRDAKPVEEPAVVDIPSDKYLPPSNDATEEPEVKTAVLSQDGYRYKTVRRFRYRHRQ